MRDLIVTEAYEFVPPYERAFWVRLVRPCLARFLSGAFGVERVECRGTEHLKKSLDAGHGILLAANHCRPCDPMVLGVLSKQVGRPFFTMASWHLFMKSRWLRWFIRRMGAFSVYREGVDRAAVSYAIGVLEKGRRPLVIFPEGVISRTNDVLFDLMGGTAIIARGGARKRAKAGSGSVVVHPVATKYLFHGDLTASITPILAEIETRLTWRPQEDLELMDRVYKVGVALLGLKETEHLGAPQEGEPFERAARLVDAILAPIEAEWLEGEVRGDVVSRVKRLRIAVLPDLVEGEVDDEETERRWHQFEDMFLAQQIASFPPKYIGETAIRERVLETVERFEEDITGRARVHAPMSAIVEVGPPIEVSTDRPPKGEADPLLEELETSLRSMLAALGEEAQARRATAIPT